MRAASRLSCKITFEIENGRKSEVQRSAEKLCIVSARSLFLEFSFVDFGSGESDWQEGWSGEAIILFDIVHFLSAFQLRGSILEYIYWSLFFWNKRNTIYCNLISLILSLITMFPEFIALVRKYKFHIFHFTILHRYLNLHKSFLYYYI